MTEFAAQNNILNNKKSLSSIHHQILYKLSLRPPAMAMKIAHMNKENEKDNLELLLNNYRDTPHPTTGLTPASMLFRDDKCSTFPRKSVRTKDIIEAIIRK